MVSLKKNNDVHLSVVIQKILIKKSLYGVVKLKSFKKFRRLKYAFRRMVCTFTETKRNFFVTFSVRRARTNREDVIFSYSVGKLQKEKEKEEEKEEEKENGRDKKKKKKKK